MSTLRPENPDQVRDAVAWAAAEEAPLEVVGLGSKRGLGRPFQASHSLDLSALAGISLYEPEELVMTAGAGTRLAEVEARLADQGQELAFEPVDLGPLLGAPDGAQTVGGVIACNLAGPRRIKVGAARDHFLGVKAVSGRGEAFKSGGRVVKNVTGYDLCKLLAGSHGTLAVMTEITVKVLPAPETSSTVLVFGLDDPTAVQALTQALQSPSEVSGAAHLPAALATAFAVARVAGAGASVTAVRVEGVAPSVAYRAGALKDRLGAFGEIGELDDGDSATLWREIRDVRPFVEDRDRQVWRLSVPPAAGPGVVEEIGQTVDALAYYDWGGGLIWLAVAPGPDAAHEAVRGAVKPSGGHATLIRASDDVRTRVPVFPVQSDALAELTRRVKDSFDPRRILNPGRMYAGM